MIGAWQSNEVLTRIELEGVTGLSQEQREILKEPELFGNLINVYGSESSISIYEGQCSKIFMLKIIDSGPGYVTFRFYDEFYEKEMESTIFYDGTVIWLDLFNGKSKEIFSRIDRSELEKEYPCVKAVQ